MLKAGVDFATISQWLGHASLNTTMTYARADLDLKRQALMQVFPDAPRPPRGARQPRSIGRCRVATAIVMRAAAGLDSDCGIVIHRRPLKAEHFFGGCPTTCGIDPLPTVTNVGCRAIQIRICLDLPVAPSDHSDCVSKNLRS
jgi:hypothetical protein